MLHSLHVSFRATAQRKDQCHGTYSHNGVASLQNGADRLTCALCRNQVLKACSTALACKTCSKQDMALTFAGSRMCHNAKQQSSTATTSNQQIVKVLQAKQEANSSNYNMAWLACACCSCWYAEDCNLAGCTITAKLIRVETCFSGTILL